MYGMKYVCVSFIMNLNKKIHTSIIRKTFNTYLICLFLIIKNVYFLEKTSFIKKYVHICTLLTMLKRIKFTNINISVKIQSTRI